LGYLRDRNPNAPARLTWAEVTHSQKGKFRLLEVRTTELAPGTKLFGLGDLNKARRALFLSDKPEDARIAPRDYELLLESGLSAVVADLDAPRDDGVERPREQIAPPPGQAPGAAPKETELTAIVARYLNWSQASLQLSIEYDQQERTVLRNSATGRMEPGPWRKQKLTKAVTLPNDADGGIRFTDRANIYEITKEGFSVHCHTYDVQPNPVPK
jgi:hypothetical protein